MPYTKDIFRLLATLLALEGDRTVALSITLVIMNFNVAPVVGPKWVTGLYLMCNKDV